MRLLLPFFLLMSALTVVAQEQSDARLKSYEPFDWVATEHVFTEPLTVTEGDWVVMTITCRNGQYIKDCGQPEYYNTESQYRLLIPCIHLWTLDGTTEQTFAIEAPATGTFSIDIPVLIGYVEYKGSYMVIAGPEDEPADADDTDRYDIRY